jgi:PAS domain S-box-containing protein
MAKREAYKAYEKDVMLRAWATMHGGVYVPVTSETPPNPYLEGVKERDITTPSGRKLTLINPAYMTRQVHELSRTKLGIISHITSLDPIRKENAPDGWEKAALMSFELGVKEYSGFDTINTVRYFRYMAPLVTGEGCLQCHAVQGYKVGQIRGGISSAVPWAEYENSIGAQMSHVFIEYGLIWTLGIIGLYAFSRRLGKYLAQRDSDEKEIKQLNELLHEAQEVGHIGYFVGDVAAGTWASSPVLDEIFGIDMSFVRDVKHWEAMIAEEHRQPVTATFSKAMNEKGRFTFDYKITRPADGDERWVSVIAEFESDESGRPFRYIGTVQDITERKRLEHQLIQSQKLEGVGTLAGGIAHDFNNLLAMILGSAELLREQLTANPDLKKYADGIVEASNRGASISRQLLLFSRPNEAVLKHISLSETIVELKDMLKHFLPKSITIVTKQTATDAVILGDAGQIHQALLNLSLNAGDAMANNGTLTIEEFTVDAEAIRTRFGYDAAAPYAAVAISDTGTGIDESILKNIFDPFFSTKEKGKGTGLGLAIVHGIVKNHNGFIDVDSTVGTGTTFTLYFPSLPQPAQAIAPPAVSHDDEHSGTILLVDDEQLLREMLAEFLTDIGYSVHEATNGNEALEFFTVNRDSIDLVITDLGMPEMGGEELYRRLRDLDVNVKVIVSSGYLDGTTRNDLLDMGIETVLTKPFKMQDIQKAVRSVLGN